MIVHFTIKHCVGLSKIELRNLQKIKMVSIYMDRKQPVEIQTPTLEYFFCCGHTGNFLDLEISACQNLKSLKLSCVKISDGFIEHLTSRCEFLECLMLDNIVSKGLKRFKVCGRQSLKKMVIRGCNGIAMIDAPNLESLEYVGHQVPVLKTGKTFGPLKNSRIELYCVGNLNALWFCKLRKFLFNSNSLLHITLHFPKCNKIYMQNWDPYRGLFDIPQIDVLNVHLTRVSEVPDFCGCFTMELSSWEAQFILDCANDYMFQHSFNAYEEFNSFYFSWKLEVNPSLSLGSILVQVDFSAFLNGGSSSTEVLPKWSRVASDSHSLRCHSRKPFGILGDYKVSASSISQEFDNFLLNAIGMSFFERLSLAWKIMFPPSPSASNSAANIAKQRLKMILFSDRCAVSEEAKQKIVSNVISALSDFVEIESQEKVQLSVSTDPDLGTIYSVTVPVRRVRSEYQVEDPTGTITNIDYKDTGDSSGSVDVKFDFYIPNENFDEYGNVKL
ncbi:Cell division topological specificity factor -like protein, chloroplastic [Capsicum chinense]|nr:Cell division topological specificity factor -like protein, chloroplastic [Capsicum chinense]